MSGTIGANTTNTLTTTDSTGGKLFGLGDRQWDQSGNEFVYVQASGAITGAGYVCYITAAYLAVMVSTSNDAIGNLIGVPAVAFADGDYGWLQTKGVCVVRAAALAAANVRLNSTATAGQLDDDGSASAMAIDGLVLTTAVGGSAATAAAVISYPIIISIAESQFTDGVTPGTAAVNKALVLGAAGEIATITTLTATTINSTASNPTTINTGAIVGSDSSLGITGLAAAVGGDVVVSGAAASSTNGGNVILNGGALSGSGKTGTVISRGIRLRSQGAPAAKTVTAAITAAELVGGLITTTGVTAPSVHQLPTGTLIDAELPGVATGDSFDFSIINTGTGGSDDATITVNTDVTIVGSPTVGAITDATIISGSGRWRARRSGANTWVVYRLS